MSINTSIVRYFSAFILILAVHHTHVYAQAPTVKDLVSGKAGDGSESDKTTQEEPAQTIP